MSPLYLLDVSMRPLAFQEIFIYKTPRWGDKHFIEEKLETDVICIPYLPSIEQIADVLTKGLPKYNSIKWLTS